MQHINYCSHAEQLTFNCHKGEGGGGGGEEGRIMAQLFILSYSDAVSFRDIRGHLGTIPSIVTFYISSQKATIAGSPVGIPGNKNRTNLSSEETEKHVLVLSRCPCWPITESPLSYFFVYKLFSSWIWLKYCMLHLKQAINQSINSHTLLYPALLMCRHCFLT